jgi:hypothetical protein
MQEFLEMLNKEQLEALEYAVKGEVIRRQRAVKKTKHRIHIGNIPEMSDDFEDTREDIMDAMGDIRSKKIFVNIEKSEAKVTFENAETAAEAFPLLKKKYQEVRIY